MTVRNQPGMSLDDVAALTRRIGGGFFAEAERVDLETATGRLEIDTPAGRSAFLRGIAAAIAADQKREGTISAALLAKSLAREGRSVQVDQEILLRDVVASGLIRRAKAAADNIDGGLSGTSAGEDALTGRIINVLGRLKKGDRLDAFIAEQDWQAFLNHSADEVAAERSLEGYRRDDIAILPVAAADAVARASDRAAEDRASPEPRPAVPESSIATVPSTQTVAAADQLIASSESGADLPLFEDLWVRFTSEKAVKNEWGKQQQIQAKSTRRVFVEICENRAPGAYTKADADEFKLIMLSLPSKYAHNTRWCRMRATDGLKMVSQVAVAENQAIEAAHRKGDRSQSKHEMLDPKTYDRHHSCLAEFWRWAERKGLLTSGHGQIFDGLFIDIPKVSGRSLKAKAKRDEWHEPMLTKLFEAPVLTGQRSRYWWKHPGEQINRDDRYWGCLLGPHHGMRREEFFQLKVGHVQQDPASGIYHFDLMSDPPELGVLRLKDSGSPRLVPLHKNIIELGFIEERVLGREATEMLFPEARLQDAAGYHGARFGDWFGRFCDWLCAPTNNDFHSFRLTFINRLLRAGIAPHLVDELAGHESHERRSVQDQYVRSLPLPMLKEIIDQLVLPIDIPSLKDAARRMGRVDFSIGDDD
ncbi:tyrosine-type recombinase/integrase [Bosea vaviloviae]|nr:tyrosine-type recombinase/integrase [Bosea vaviloviae]